MNKKNQNKLYKKLSKLAPVVPSFSTKKSNTQLIEELFIIAPELPFTRVSGKKMIKQFTIPSSPNQKK